MQAGLSLGAFMSSIMRWRSGLIVSAVMGNGRAQPPFSRRNKTLSFQGICDYRLQTPHRKAGGIAGEDALALSLTDVI